MHEAVVYVNVRVWVRPMLMFMVKSYPFSPIFKPLLLSKRYSFPLVCMQRWSGNQPHPNPSIAFNLDGGGSTGYYAGPNDAIDSLTPIPAVVACIPGKGTTDGHG